MMREVCHPVEGATCPLKSESRLCCNESELHGREYSSLKKSTQSEYSWLSKSTQRPHICEVQAAAAGGRVVWSPVNRALSLLPSPCNDLNIAPHQFKSYTECFAFAIFLPLRIIFYRTRVRSLFTLVTNSLTNSLTH